MTFLSTTRRLAPIGASLALFGAGAASAGSTYVDSAAGAYYPQNYTGACPHTFRFEGQVYTYATPTPVTVKYQWVRSDGAKGPIQSILIKTPTGNAGVHTAEYNWTLGKPFTGWAAVNVLSPNVYAGNHAAISLSCK